MTSRWMAALIIGLLAFPGAGEMQVAAAEKELRATRNTEGKETNLQLAAMKMRKPRAGSKSPEENKKAGEAFLEENKTKEGVVILPSGLQYKILKAGDGKIPVEGDTVDCFVRATLIDNTVVGGSPRGKPSTFKVGQSIPGLSEALKLMPVGSKWQLFIPPELAFGEKGTRGRVGPNETLIYEVELLAVK